MLIHSASPVVAAAARLSGALGLSLWCAFAGIASAAEAPAADTLTLDVDIADTSIAYVDAPTQATLWPEVWRRATVVAYYLPTEGIEGETQKTRPRLHLFSCMIGTACIPDPRIEMETSQVVRKVVVQAQAAERAPGQPTSLRFTLPASPAPHYRFSHAVFQASAEPLWRTPRLAGWDRELPSGGRRTAAQQRKEPLSIALAEAASDAKPGYQMVDLGVQTPGQLSQYGNPLAVTMMRAQLREPDGATRPLVWPGVLPPGISEQLAAAPESVTTGQLPDAIRQSQFPERLSSFHVKERMGTVAMPADSPRWHGLKHYNFANGTRVILMQSGPIAQVDLEAEADADRRIDGRTPVKHETWLFFDGQLMRYRGSLHYGNNADQMPQTVWRMDWADGQGRTAMAEDQSPSSLVTQAVECRWQACHDNLAEAQAQLAKSDAELQIEGARYLQLAKTARD